MKKVIIISLAILSAIVLSSCDLLGITTQEEDPAGQSPVKEASNVVEEKPQEENAQAVTAENEAQVEEVIRPEGPAGPLDYIYPPFKDVYLADTSVDIETARKYFKEGVSLFEDGEFDEQINLFRSSLTKAA